MVTRGRKAVDWALRNRQTGQITIAQRPNAPVIVFAALRVGEALGPSKGATHNVLHWGGTAALVWWSLDEVIRGVNPFRRALGLAVLGYAVATV